MNARQPLKPDYWDQRLDNWARCYLGGSNLIGSSLDPDKVPPDARDRLAAVWEEPAAVVLIGEAIDTDVLVCKLVAESPKAGYPQAIKAWYWSSGTREFAAASIGMSRTTLWRRICDAKERLAELHFQARRNFLKREVEGALGPHRLRS